MSALDALLAETAEEKAVAELRLLNNKRKGAESRAADETAKAVLDGRFRYNPGLAGWNGTTAGGMAGR